MPCELTDLKEIEVEQLLREVDQKRDEGHRFVTMTCVDNGELFEILYHFDREYQLSNLRVKLKRDQHLPSVSHIYFAAVIIENEIKDLFGIPVHNMVVDYEGRFMLSENAPQAPQAKIPGAALDVRIKPHP